MPNRSISKDLKERALWLIAHNYVPLEVCDMFDVSERSIRLWKANQHIYGTVILPPNPKQGRPRILNADMTHDLYTLNQEAPEMYLDEIQDWLALAYDTGIAKTTLFKNIRDMGITYKLLRKAAAERDEEARQEWMDDMRTHFIASQLVMVDESSKVDRTIYHHYGRALNGQRATISANFVRGDQYTMLAALSVDGLGYEALHVVPGSVDGEQFLDFILHDLVSDRLS